MSWSTSRARGWRSGRRVVRGGSLLWRLLHAGMVLCGVLTVVFLLLRLTPGDPVLLMVPPDAPPSAVAALRHALGLDQPLPVQFADYAAHVVRGDFGISLRDHRPVSAVVLERLPATLELAGASMLLAVCVAVPLGVLGAARRGGAVDVVTRTLALLAESLPTFWVGILLIILFAVQWRVLPTSGRGSLAHLVLPSVTLSFTMIGLLAQVTRTALLEVLDADYMRTGRAKGLPEAVVLLRHGLRNALIPIMTLVGLQTGTLLGGAIITESVFSWPGIGLLAINAIYQRDYPLVQGVVALAGVVFVVLNFLVDVGYAYLDPRIRYT
jgi:ABC-type dipeptide/oligopeptide/nickel transport system permease component